MTDGNEPDGGRPRSPEKIGPQLDFQYLAGGDNNPEVGKLPPHEQLAAKFGAWVTGFFKSAEAGEAQELPPFTDGVRVVTLKPTAGPDGSDEPVRIELSIRDNTTTDTSVGIGGARIYTAVQHMEGLKQTHMSASVAYNVIPTMRDDKPGFAVNDVSLRHDDMEFAEVDEVWQTEFLQRMETDVNALKDRAALGYQVDPNESY